MSRDVTFELTNEREFDRVMGKYAELSSKDTAEAINHQTVNLGFQGLRATPKAVKSEISATVKQPRLIAHILSQRPPKHPENRQSHRGGVWYTRQEAKRYAVKLARMRRKAVGFTRGFFSAWIDEAKHLTQGAQRKPNAKRFQGFNIHVRKAIPQRLSMDIEVAYSYRKRGAKTAKRTEDILQVALRRAEQASIRDMQRYIERKMEKRAKQFTATGKMIARAI